MPVSSLRSQVERLSARVDKLCYTPPVWECPNPVELARQAGIELDDWQRAVCESRAPRVACNVSRQLGKSTVGAILGMHKAYSTPGSLTVVISPSLNQSSELALKCKSLHARLGRPIRAMRESVLSIHLANGSRVVCVPGTEDTSRGYSPDLIIIDEAARLEDPTWFSLTPMVSVSGGRIITLSTPRFEIGWWWDAITHHRESWAYWEVPASSCGRVDPAFLESEKESMGELFYGMEYECRFGQGAGQCFRSEDIEKIIKDSVVPWNL